MKKIYAICMIGLCLCFSCSNKGKTTATGQAEADSAMNPKYATGYEVRDSNGVRLVDVGKGYHFALVTNDNEVDVPDGYTKVRVPIKNTICMTALQLSNFTILDAHDVVKGITGITLVPHLGYQELDPLGQAEWIKFVGMFIGKEKEANELFAGIESRYQNLKSQTSNLKPEERPTVLSGEMHYGNWHAVGGKNYLAQIFRDAGAEYVINDEETGGEDLEF